MDRESRQTRTSHLHLLESIRQSDEAARLVSVRMAMLTAPLGRELAADEVEVRLSKLIEFSSQPLSCGVVAEQVSSSGQPVADLPASYYTFHDAYLTYEGYVVADGQILVDDIQFILPNWQRGRGHPWFYDNLPFRSFSPADATCIVKLPSELVEEAIFIFNSKNAAVNFGHFVHDFLIQIRVWRHVRLHHPEVKAAFVGSFAYPMQRFIVDALFATELANGSFVERRWPGRFRTIYAASPQFPAIENAIDIASAVYVREQLRSLVMAHVEPGVLADSHKRVFISRSDGTNSGYGREAVHEQVLEEIFVSFGFQPVVVSRLSPLDILRTFGGAETVAGMHGAGLLNILFSAASRPHLIEIDAVTPTWRSIERFVRAANVRHDLIKPGGTPNAPDYAQTGKAVAQLLATPV